MRKLIIALVAIIAVLSVNQSKAQNFGYMDTQAIIEVLPSAKAAQKSLEAEAKKIDDQIQIMGQEYQDKVRAYQENIQLAPAAQEKWSAAIQADKEQEIMQLQERIQKFQENAQISIQQKRQELFKPVLDSIDAAVAKVAKAGNFVVIMEKNSVLYINPDLAKDVTDSVKKELGL